MSSSYGVLREGWKELTVYNLHGLSVSMERCLLLLESIAFTSAAAYRISVISAGYGGHSLCAFCVGLKK